ncbi:MAG: methyltransferase family protein [Acidiferrobacterales bacterium]
MNLARYVLALAMVVLFLPAISFWFLIHPFSGFWRRLGPWRTYAILLSTMMLLAVVIYQFKDWLLAVEFGTSYVLLAFAIVIYAGSTFVEWQCRRHLSLATLIGLPQLAPGRQDGVLLTQGIYARIRHPRYVAVFLGVIAIALSTNYLAVYILIPLSAIALYLIVLLEEKELQACFGDAYIQYCARVPRFLPTARQAAGRGS